MYKIIHTLYIYNFILTSCIFCDASSKYKRPGIENDNLGVVLLIYITSFK